MNSQTCIDCKYARPNRKQAKYYKCHNKDRCNDKSFNLPYTIMAYLNIKGLHGSTHYYKTKFGILHLWYSSRSEWEWEYINLETIPEKMI